MDNRSEAPDFLASRRAKISPQQTGLTAYGANRRVPGLRRGEVAMLAGLSSDYYVRLERGNLAGVSESVLHAVRPRAAATRPNRSTCTTWRAPPAPGPELNDALRPMSPPACRSCSKR
jgi:hypothetical protein